MDDVGGLRYLYSTNNVAPESLLSGTRGVGTNANSYVGTALRPGIDRITFQRLAFDPGHGQFVALTNRYVDSYYTNGVLRQQALERVITQPDILFTAHDIGLDFFSRSGTGGWINNGAPGHDGPGVIQPPVAINFNRLGPYLSHIELPAYIADYPSSQPLAWGSFGGTTNTPIAYPAVAATNVSTTIQFWLYSETAFPLEPVRHQTWQLEGNAGDVFAIQTTTNLLDWTAIASVPNSGGVFGYFDSVHTNTPRRYFRTVRE
jgi:hypothetical protein